MLLGDDDRPLPNLLMMTMKYLVGSSALPGVDQPIRDRNAARHTRSDRRSTFDLCRVERAKGLIGEARVAVGQPRLQDDIARLEDAGNPPSPGAPFQ